MLWPFNQFRKPPLAPRGTIETIYGMIVTQAREPLFYRDLGVADTVNGRFDLLLMHLWLVLRRLRAVEGDRGLSQALFDHFCTDMDDNLREMGVGDLTVPKRMQAFGEAFYGRTAAYDLALTDGREALAQAFSRNILNGDKIDHARQLAAYAEAVIATLDAARPGDAVGRIVAIPVAASERAAVSRTDMTDRSDPWRAPVTVAQIPETGLHRDIEADAGARRAMAEVAGLREVLSAHASFDVTPGRDGRFHVAGVVRALIGQTCVVTLEEIENEISEPIDLIFTPPEQIPQMAALADEAEASGEETPDPPEPIVNGIIDLGRVATDALYLAIDPYPRKADAVFEPVVEAVDPEDHPFAALKALKAGMKTPRKPKKNNRK